MFIFGGIHIAVERSDEIVQYSLSTNVALTVARLPGGRYASAAVRHGADRKMYVFSGSSGSAGGPYLDEIVQFDHITKEVKKLAAALPKKFGFSYAVSVGEHLYYWRLRR